MKYYKVPFFLYEPMLEYLKSKPAGEVARLVVALEEMVKSVNELEAPERQPETQSEEQPNTEPVE